MDCIVTKLVSVCSHGSGWQLLSINKFTLLLVRFVPVLGSSFVFFPESRLLNRKSNMLYIHKGNDDNCFFCCYTAGYHLVYKKETLESPRNCYRLSTKFITYNIKNSSATQLVRSIWFDHELYEHFKIWGYDRSSSDRFQIRKFETRIRVP